jgi:hypothetical protein
MKDLELYNIFRANGMTRAGALGTIANIRAEGLMRGNNAQDSYHFDDEQYTAAVDTGNPEFLERFCTDLVGYGYAQWTDPKRKRKLLAYAMNKGTSIGDECMQAHFIIKEMKEDFPSVWQAVSTSDDLEECVRVVLYVYENPQVKNMAARYKYALEFEAQIPDGEVPTQQAALAAASGIQISDDLTVKMLQLAMAHDGYWEHDEITGIKTPEFRQRIVEYAEDVAGC